MLAITKVSIVIIELRSVIGVRYRIVSYGTDYSQCHLLLLVSHGEVLLLSPTTKGGVVSRR